MTGHCRCTITLSNAYFGFHETTRPLSVDFWIKKCYLSITFFLFHFLTWCVLMFDVLLEGQGQMYLSICFIARNTNSSYINSLMDGVHILFVTVAASSVNMTKYSILPTWPWNKRSKSSLLKICLTALNTFCLKVFIFDTLLLLIMARLN